jgi:anthranilate/para-aminobenzoate synthase component I
VEAGKEHVRAGDVFQVVLSQRFEVRTDVDALDLYRVLRNSNPSPYMYLLRFAGRESPYDVVGSSPEALVTVAGDSAVVHPPAGTRPRGATPAADAAAAAELRADPKERAEHVMLVDLARNDLGRVCVPGTVDVSGFMRVERYSHVMHLVSTVFGRVMPGRTALDVLRATFPAGTVSGAPKPRAWRSSRRSSRTGATSTRGPSATSTPVGTWTWRSRSAPRCCTAARRTCRPAPGSSPTATRPASRPSARTRRPRSCAPSPPPRRCSR